MTLAERTRWAGTRLGLLALLASTGVAGFGLTGARAATTPRTTQQTWTVQPTPRIPSPIGSFADVSCPSVTFCMTVGEPAAAVYNGSAWKQEPVPSTGVFGTIGVSCVSSVFCVAVGGSYQVRLAIDGWNGTTWTAQQAPADNGRLAAVSCASTAACLAVGGTVGRHHTVYPIAAWWNGTKWRRVASPLLRDFPHGVFNGVSCSSPTACTVVGTYEKSRVSYPLIERWNGASMVEQEPAQQPRKTASVVNAVSCPDATDCIATGTLGDSPHMQSWNGTQWTAMKSPNVAADLVGLSCSASTACIAAGYRTSKNGRQSAFAEQLTGTNWTIQQAVVPKGLGNSLAGVSCAQAASCTAVGTYESVHQKGRSLGEYWNGARWAIQRTPNAYWPPQGSLGSLSCAGPAACTAIGTMDDNSPLSEGWDGTRWSIGRQLLPASPPTVPENISCPTATMCMAVGFRDGGAYPWAAVWNGGRWATVNPPDPSPGAVVEALNAVSCTSATFCIAVGSEGNTPEDSLAYAWNGTTWTALPIPVTSSYLYGVSCTSPVWCVAVGGSTTWLALIWNGQTWTPTATTGDPLIDAVSCSSATACTAVGMSAGEQAAIERWDGTTWTAEQPASAPPGYNIAQLNGVSCASASACTAVGYYWNGQASNTSYAFIQSWDGTAWTAEQAPDTGYSDLDAVACTAQSACIAVGAQQVGTVNQEPLAETSG